MKYVPAAVSKQIARQALHMQKHAPEILFGVGVVSMVASTVTACRATLQLETILDKGDHDLKMHEAVAKRHANERPLPEGVNEYTQEMLEHDKRIIRIRTARDIVKAYAPAVILGAAGIACLTKSHDILAKRNAALMAAYVAIDEAFNKYRERVVEKYGEEADRNFRYGTRQETVQDENDHRKHHEVTRVSLDEPSMYARFFDPLSTNWSVDPEVNFMFLRMQQNWANDRLKIKGHVFLNEVYDALGLGRSKEGAVVGWLYDPASNDSDNYIDFGVFNVEDGRIKDFVMGRDHALLLDFNVDGVIFDKIGQRPITWRDDEYWKKGAN